MKKEIFNQYVKKVTNIFHITEQELFSKTKKREVVDARQLLYFLCFKRPMKIIYIEKYMNESGYPVGHSTIIFGISSMEKKMLNDIDYVTIIKQIENSVFV
jgi:chromosomal replication initiation ATPase DnaA